MLTSTIELKGLSTGYVLKKKRQKVVAKNINATLFGGELTCLLGANGIGKSTLLRTLSAFQPKLAGDVLVAGKPLESYSEKSLSRLVSVVLTEKTTIRNMTAHRLISIGRSPYTDFWGSLTDSDRQAVDRAIELVRIQSLMHREVDTLSDGERQKVMIAKALAQDTPIILLDEPTAFLDFPSKVEIMQLLHRLSRETGKTIFLSTHDLELALQIADKIWLVGKDARIAIGTPEDLALNGSLSHFFAHEGIEFDSMTGLFRVRNACRFEVFLSGSGMKYAMIRKALFRNAIAVSDNENSAVRIELSNSDNLIRISHNRSASHEVQTVDEMLNYLQTILL